MKIIGNDLSPYVLKVLLKLDTVDAARRPKAAGFVACVLAAMSAPPTAETLATPTPRRGMMQI